MSKPDENKISSPMSTGGAGIFFEQHVDAYWLALMLVQGIPPLLKDYQVNEVSFQTEHLGWKTDDFLVSCINKTNKIKHLIGQAKLNVTVSANCDKFSKLIYDFWEDFNNSDKFDPHNDYFVITVPLGSKTLLEDFANLLALARSVESHDEFFRRLSLNGFVNNTVKRYCEEIRKILMATKDTLHFDNNLLWQFLKSIYILSLDFNNSTHQTESQIINLLAFANTDKSIDTARNTWNALLALVGSNEFGVTKAGSFTRNTLPKEIIDSHNDISSYCSKFLNNLSDHSQIVLNGIRNNLNGTLYIDRCNAIQEIVNSLTNNQVVFITGVAGSGKSALAKDVINKISNEYICIAFRAEEFSYPHFNPVRLRCNKYVHNLQGL